MALYDMQCLDCHVVVEDFYATTSADLRADCPECGRPLQWKPFVRTQSTRAPFFSVQAGKHFNNYSDLERWARDSGKTVVPRKEFERNHLKRYTTEERFMKRYDSKKTMEAIRKAKYRLTHGYRDSKAKE